jgi:DNA-entry nuclease
MNVDGMLPFENQIAAYVKETENHVLYRVTPIFVDDELVCRGVLMEAMSVEDNGEDLLFCVYVYNNQPGITINYKTGASYLSGSQGEGGGVEEEPERVEVSSTFILNKNSKKIHTETCSYGKSTSEKNKEIYTGLYSVLIESGYSACSHCEPTAKYQ